MLVGAGEQPARKSLCAQKLGVCSGAVLHQSVDKNTECVPSIAPISCPDVGPPPLTSFWGSVIIHPAREKSWTTSYSIGSWRTFQDHQPLLLWETLTCQTSAGCLIQQKRGVFFYSPRVCGGQFLVAVVE